MKSKSDAAQEQKVQPEEAMKVFNPCDPIEVTASQGTNDNPATGVTNPPPPVQGEVSGQTPEESDD